MGKINHTLVTTQVTEYIKDSIVSGKWKLGDKIPSENELSRELGVSRATLRMSIQRFVSLKILRPEQGRGCYLISDAVERLGSGLLPVHACDDLKAVLEFRRLIEPQAVKWAMQQGQEKQQQLADRLAALQERMENTLNDVTSFMHVDMEFHLAIAAASGNEVLHDCLGRVFESTPQIHRQMTELFGYTNGLKFHEKILKSVREGSERKAVQYMERHITHALDGLVKKAF